MKKQVDRTTKSEVFQSRERAKSVFGCKRQENKKERKDRQASGNLGSTFDINLVFAEPQIVWYGFYYTDAVVPQTVINIWGEGMFSPLIVQYLAEKS